MDIKDFLPVPNIEECGSMLCVQPHPDDNEVGAAATIAKLAATGCKITYLTVTDGSLGTVDPAVKGDALASIRRKEVEKSAAFLGVKGLIFLGFEDGGYIGERLLCQSIVSAIRRVKPEIVLTVDPFLPYEAHPDHRRVGMAAAEACLFSGFPLFRFADGTQSADTWAVKGIAFHTTAHPNAFIDVTGTWEKKMQAIALHESQFAPQYLQMLGYYFDFKSRMYAQGRPFERAEAFKVLTTDCLHMNVDTVNL